MTIHALQAESATANPSIDILEDASADLDTARTFFTACENFIYHIRGWVRMPGNEERLLSDLADLETMICETRAKTLEAKAQIDQFTSVASRCRRDGEANNA